MSSYYEKMLATGEVKCIDEEIPFEIPQGWEWCRLRDLCTVFGRIGFRGYTRNDIVEKGFGAITLSPSNMQDNGNMNYSVLSYISWKKYEESPEIKVKANDVLIVKTGSSYGKTCIISDLPEKATINPQIAVLKYSFVNNQWLTYFLNAPFAQEQFRKYVIGTSIPTFSQEKLSSTLLPLPPKNEQEHLTKKLSLLDKWIGSYNVIQQLIDRLNADIYDKLKKSILQEAIQGKLVPQIAEEGTAKELLDQIKAEKQELVKEGKLKKSALNDSVIFRGDDNKYYEKIGKKCVDITDEIPFEIPASWAWCHLNDIAESDLGKTMNKGQNSGELVPYLCSINVYWNKIDLSKIKQAQFTEIELAKYLLQKNDLLICEGGDIGRAAIWDINETMYYQNALHRVRFYGKIFPKFFLYILSLYKALGLLDKKSKGMTIKHFTKTALNSIVIPLPPLLEQKRIIEKIEQLMQLLK